VLVRFSRGLILDFTVPSGYRQNLLYLTIFQFAARSRQDNRPRGVPAKSLVRPGLNLAAQLVMQRQFIRATRALGLACFSTHGHGVIERVGDAIPSGSTIMVRSTDCASR